MPKIEIELTDDQMKKVEILKSQGISIGEAVELLLEVQHEALAQVEEQKDDENILEKIQETHTDAEIKTQLLKKNFDDTQTYDRTVQDTKHHVKWSDVFNL